MTGRELHHALDVIWSPRPGLGRLSAVNHTIVGRRFIVTGFVFFLIGGVLALLMRTQLAVPDNTLLDHDTYNQLFTMHGTTMMFLFAVPILEGFAMYLIPKMVGARDMIFPRLSAFGYWCYLFGGLLLYSGLLVGQAPDGGWFMYPPLTSEAYTPGLNSDFWLLGVTFVEISAVAAGVEIIATILRSRAPGMAIQYLPLFAWAMLVVAFMIVFGFPPLILASILLEVERAFGLPYFDATRGGDALLWQHLFWLFGHPEVYIIFLPAAGMLSMIIPVFARTPIVGYVWVVLALVAVGFISFGLWVHHMYATGIPHLALSFFSAASLAVSIPTGIQIFAWLATLWRGTPLLRTPLLFVLGFFFIFVIGGLTGVMLAIVPFNWQVHDTYFVVAHLHYVLIGGMVFPLFAGLYYWLPSSTGRLLSERLGRWAFGLMFVGFNVSFLPMHLTGMVGMPRRVYTYPDWMGWDWLNLISTVGAYLFALGVLVFLIDVARSARREPGPRNPWQAGTLEWTIPTPVPNYNFVSIPPVRGHDPLWERPQLAAEMEAGTHYLGSVEGGRRETVGTGVVSGRAEQVIVLPGPSWTPLVSALFVAVFFVGFLIRQYELAAVGAALAAVAFMFWGWFNGNAKAPDLREAAPGVRLPMHYTTGCQAPGWWGLAIALLADGALFASLVFGYFFLWTVSDAWPPTGYDMLELTMPALALAAVVLSSAGPAYARRALLRGRPMGAVVGLLFGLLLAGLYGLLQWRVLQALPFGATEHAYGALVYTIVVFHLVHMAMAVMIAFITLLKALGGYLTPTRCVDIHVTNLFWHYTVAMWVVSFAVVHVFPEWV
ncbi:cytochrome c oxidase subunit I [Ectothiorhodospiraceae bacterium 2226]|nr:cytochrome c oxidase subunit I [Ectothiorhodospiraceae bacterium 2226]